MPMPMPAHSEEESEPMGLAVKVFGPPSAKARGERDKGEDDAGSEAFDDYAEQAFPDSTPKQRAALHRAIMACMKE